MINLNFQFIESRYDNVRDARIFKKEKLCNRNYSALSSRPPSPQRIPTLTYTKVTIWALVNPNPPHLL